MGQCGAGQEDSSFMWPVCPLFFLAEDFSKPQQASRLLTAGKNHPSVGGAWGAIPH